MSAEGLI